MDFGTPSGPTRRTNTGCFAEKVAPGRPFESSSNDPLEEEEGGPEGEGQPAVPGAA